MLRLAALVCLCTVSSSFAQIYYQPVRYQFDQGCGGATYYYGGTNPLVHELASRRCTFRGYGTNLHNFDGGNSFGQPSPMSYRTPIYTDCTRTFINVARFGYTPADARNEAYANTPRYFRKADLLNNAIPIGDGTLVVPATGPQASVAPTPIVMRGAALPAVMPKKGQIIIIPKDMLDRKVKDFEKKPQKVAAAE